MDQIRSILLVALSLIVYTAVALHAQPRYAVTDLGAFQPSAIAGPYVVGQENNLPVRLNVDTGERLLVPHAGFGAAVEAVLDTGESVGNVYQPFPSGLCCGPTWAALWHRDGSLQYLPGGGGPLSTFAFAINAQRAIAGLGDVASSPGLKGHRWFPGRPVEVLGTLGGNTSWGNGIDAHGRVWGHARTPGSEDFPITARTHAAVFHLDGRVQDLGTLDGQSSFVNGVNPEGIGVGTSGAWAFTATVEAGIAALPIPEGFDFCEGHDISGAAVGVCVAIKGSPSLDEFHATVWPSAMEAVDLNTVADTGGWVLEHARGVSADGRIVGVMLRQGERRGFLLTPIPAEPMVSLTVNQTAFAPGQTLTATVTTQDAAGLQLYVGAIFPDADTLLLMTQLSPLQGQVVRLSSNPALFPPVMGAAQPTQAFSHTFTGLEAPGTYHLVAALVPPGAFQDGVIHGEDLVGFDWTAISLTITPLHTKMQAIRDKHTRR